MNHRSARIVLLRYGLYSYIERHTRSQNVVKLSISVSAIKIGRYTLDRKTDNIKEVKSLEAMDTIIETAIVNATDADSQGSLSDQSYLGILTLL